MKLLKEGWSVDLINFLKQPEIQAAINNYDFNTVYSEVYKSDRWLYIVPDLTQMLYKSNINPLDYIDYVPQGFLLENETLTNFIIPNHIVKIDQAAFSYCINLAHIKISNSVTDIDTYAFRGCGALTHITLPRSLTNIEDYAFQYCEGLTSIELPSNLTSIGLRAFEDCTSLKNIIIPDSVTSIGRAAFAGCKNLKIAKIGSGIEFIEEDVFYGCPNLKKIICPTHLATSLNAYSDILDIY